MGKTGVNIDYTSLIFRSALVKQEAKKNSFRNVNKNSWDCTFNHQA